MRSAASGADRARAGVNARESGASTGRIRGHCRMVCRRPDGSVRWIAEKSNMIVGTGLERALNAGLTSGNLYVGLKDTGTVANGDTMASHGGWSELTNYSNATRPAWTGGSITGTTTKSQDNSGSVASFSINADDDVYGAFVSTNNTKGGTTGTLVAAVDFASSRSVKNGDTLEVTYTFTMTDS